VRSVAIQSSGPSCDTSAGIGRAHLSRWQTTVALRYTAFSLGTLVVPDKNVGVRSRNYASCLITLEVVWRRRSRTSAFTGRERRAHLGCWDLGLESGTSNQNCPNYGQSVGYLGMEAVFSLRGGHPIRLRFCASRHQASPTASCAELPGRGRSRHSWLTDVFGIVPVGV